MIKKRYARGGFESSEGESVGRSLKRVKIGEKGRRPTMRTM